MGCSCNKKKTNNNSKAFPKAVIEIDNPSKITLLRKVVIPTSLGDETTIPPAIGEYHNVVLYYEATKTVYLYSSDGIPTLITTDTSDIEKVIAQLQEDLATETANRENADIELSADIADVATDLATETTNREAADTALDTRVTDNSSRISGLTNSLVDEINNRQAADTNLQGQIDAISASSDVKDIVGTYAALQNYDTSTLGDNDIIKVLQDETQDNATTYYRWDTETQTFTLIGEEGPFYTKSEADTLLATKQDVLTAGNNIQINGTTISATDTTYSAGNGLDLTGTTFSADTDVLQEKLTAGENISISNNTISATDTTYTAGDGLELDGTEFSIDNTVALKTDLPTVNDATFTVKKNGVDVASFTANSASDVIADISVPTNNNQLTNGAGYQTAADVASAISGKQDTLTAGDNIQINGTTISATDTTYSPGNGIYFTGTVISADTDILATKTDLTAKQDVLTAGNNIDITNNVISAVDTTYTDFIGAGSSTAGDSGLVPAPAAGDNTKYLAGDGTWKTITPYSLPIASSSTLGGIKVGNNLSIDSNGVLSSADTIYTAGTGLDLTGNEFSIDNTVALKSELPNVYNATLTIKKNNTTLDTFTANSSTDKTIDIVVPTTAADVSALPASTKYGAGIGVSVNTTNYQITTTLVDQDGNTLGTPQTIDLPLESVVVDGEYDATNKKIVLTLENGSTIDIPVGDLVAGLQTELSASNKLNADFIADGTTNKVVTATEKATWNAKQNALTPGDNITITGNIISATDTIYTLPTASADVLGGVKIGENLTITDGVLSADAQPAILYSSTGQNTDGAMTQKATTDALGLKANSADLATVATSGSYTDLSNKPTIPTVNNATLTIQRNSTILDTFTANASTDKIVDITVPTKVSDLENDEGFITGIDWEDVADKPTFATVATSGSYNDLLNRPAIPAPQIQSDWTQTNTTSADYIKNKPTLATVATTGSYNDLSNKPTIPTVNNATITVQKNGTKVDDFTANQATNKTINITVPTTAADVSALPASTKYAASLSLSIDSSTYIVTGQLKDQDGNNIGSAQTIDLPLESVVVDGEYDATNKKIVLTLEGGSTIDIPVGDLVAGLQSEITAQNKLSSDLVDDTGHSNKFATASQLSKLDNLPTITTIGSNLSLTNGTLSAVDTTYSDFVGADGTDVGTHGLVPAPTATDNTKYLKGDGTWGDPTFTLPIASDSVLGGVKVGSGLSIDPSTGVMTATGTSTILYSTTGQHTDGAMTQKATTDAIDLKANSADLATVATSGSYDDLSNKPTIPAAQVNSDWNASSGVAQILNKPTIPTVNNATLTIQKNGADVQTFTANSSTNKTANITVPTKTSDITNDSGFITKSVSDLTNYTPTSSLATVATSGSYNDLSNKPTIPAAQVQSDWGQTTTTAVDYIKNKPSLSTVATTGNYEDLSNKPTIPAAQVNSDWNATSGKAQILNKPTIPTVPTNVSAFTNDANYQNGTQVSTAISNAIGQITQFDYQVVQTLPSTGVKGTIYLVPNSGTSPNIYDEYVWIVNGGSGSFEKIGTTEIDLSDYVTNTELSTELASYTPTSGLATVATSGSYNDLSNKPTIPTVPTAGTTATAVSTTSSGGSATTWSKSDHVHSIASTTITGALGYTPYDSANPSGYTSNTGTITKVQANGTDVASSGTANIPAATTSKYGVTKLTDSVSSTDTSTAATPNSVKQAYDLANGKQDIKDWSTTEVDTGVKWTDGKPIYRRVIDSGVLTGNSNILWDALSGVSTLISANGYWINGSNNSETVFNGTFAVEISGKTCVQTTRAILYTSGADAGKVKLQFTQVLGTLPSTVRMIVALEYTKL